ncbi:MAG TPA: hypothetical protein VI363_05145 [Burkholderiales bacterium]
MSGYHLQPLGLRAGALSERAQAPKICDSIAPPHPRYTQLTQMAAEVARRTHGTLTIAINPGGKVLYPGQASLDAVRNKTVPLAFINSAFLQSIDPDLGFLNLPFAIADQTRDFSSAHPEVMRRFRAVVGVD